MASGEYLVSVVTPFHNARLDLFEKGVESLKKQTIGFENIEWIIALHNCEEQYLTAARALVNDFPNVTVFELYNEHHTASSPRNECMKLVTGKYVFFLDADDFLFPHALETLRNAMEENEADIGSFREESIVGSEGLVRVNRLRMKTLFDQTRPLIVLHRDNPEISNWIDSGNGTVHKMYRTALLHDNGITFDDEVVIGEDMAFNMICLKYTNTLVVLPQTIGYGYVMNAGSLAQTLGGGEGLDGAITTLRDGLAWVTAGAECGLDASNIAWLGLVRAAKVLSSPGLPQEVIDEWRPRFAAYADSFPPMRGNSKNFSEPEAQGIMKVVRSYFQDGDAAGVNDNEGLLYHILSNNAETEIGLKHRFDRIRSHEAFKRAVPLSTYDFYGPLVQLTTRIGETNIFSAEPPLGYSLTSGATGPAKLIPYSPRHLEAYMAALRDVLANGEPTFALLESLPNEMEYVDGGALDSIVGAALTAIRLEIVDCSYAKRFKHGAVTSPIELLFPDEVIDPRYPRLLFALLDRDVSQIVAPFTWTLLDTMQFLEKHHDQLADDIEHGEITYERDIPEEIRAKLQEKLSANPERADELRAAFADGFEGIMGRIWPQCRRIVAAGTGAFSLYTRKLSFYSGDIALDNGYYAASEAMIGRSMGEGSNEYALLTTNAFFEFLQPGSDEPVMATDVVPGRSYEVVLTNAAGLYRYRLDDVVRIERFENGVPIFTYAYRLGETLEVGGAVVTEDQMEAMVPVLEEASGADIRDFCVMEEDGRLTLLVEPANSPEAVDKLASLDPERASKVVDAALRKINAAYNDARETGATGAPRVRALQAETQLLYRDRIMFFERVAPDQMKPVRVLDTDEKRKFFTTFCM